MSARRDSTGRLSGVRRGDERVEAEATNRHVMMYDINGVDPQLLAELLQFDHVRVTGNGGSDEADPAPGTFPWLEILP